MKLILSVLLLISLAGCGEEQMEVRKDPADLELVIGMDLATAVDLLGRVDAKRVENAYHLPWTTLDGDSGGRHDYYDLKDGTCVQLKVEMRTPEEMVVGIAVGPPGRPYIGKMEWFEDEETGQVKQVEKVRIGNEIRPE